MNLVQKIELFKMKTVENRGFHHYKSIVVIANRSICNLSKCLLEVSVNKKLEQLSVIVVYRQGKHFFCFENHFFYIFSLSQRWVFHYFMCYQNSYQNRCFLSLRFLQSSNGGKFVVYLIRCFWKAIVIYYQLIVTSLPLVIACYRFFFATYQPV